MNVNYPKDKDASFLCNPHTTQPPAFLSATETIDACSMVAPISFGGGAASAGKGLWGWAKGLFGRGSTVADDAARVAAEALEVTDDAARCAGQAPNVVRNI